jgi:ubiquinol-cytochrome c reductase cytochrome b subunit
MPYLFTDPEIFVEANPLVSPLHIVPEWYFLYAYAILRAQPVKVVGVVLLVLSLIVPATLGFIYRELAPLTVIIRIVVWWFRANVVLLRWLGQCPVEEPFTTLRVICTAFYFFLLGILVFSYVLVDWLFESNLSMRKNLVFMI